MKNLRTGLVKALVLAGMSVYICSAQHIIFKTGFEANTTLAPIPSNQTYSYGQLFSGTDNSTGYNWSTFPYQSSSPVQLHDEGESDALANHFFNKLDNTFSHSGSQSLFLDISGFSTSACCPQVPLQSSAVNNAAKQAYYRFWMFYPSSLGSYLSTNSSFYSRTGMAYKSADDYRIHFDLNTTINYTSLHPHMQADAGGINCSSAAAGSCMYMDPITGAIYQDLQVNRKFVNLDNNVVSVPIGSWFLVEISFKRSLGNDGYYDAAINGQTVAHTFGPNYGVSLEEIRDMYWISLYTRNFFPVSQWVDDLEIWDASPCGQFPCGSGNTTTYTGQSAPFITSRQGAVGEVGTPFSFQLTATQSPTNWQAGGLPSGLSLNTSTGLISGVPSSAGTVKVWINAYNSSGKDSRLVEFQMNNPAGSLPTISSFTANSSTVNSGQWVQLRWAQSGAKSMSIDQGVGDVTGGDPFPVQPSGSTTYTLTATNRVGSVHASVTISVNGGSSAPVITSSTSANAVVGNSFSYQITATNSPTSYGASGLPSGLSVNTSTGLISGTPTTTGTSNVIISATNSFGSGTATLVLTRVSVPPPHLSISLQQGASIHGSSLGSVAVGFPGSNTAGNLIVAAVRMSTTTQTVTVKDSLGNAYVDALAQSQTADGHQVHIFYARNVKAGSNTVTATFSATNNHPWLSVYEFSGLNTSTPLGFTHSAQGSGTSVNSGSITGTGGAQLLFSVAGFASSWTGTANTGAGYTQAFQDTSTSRADTEYEILSDFTGSYSGTFNLSTATNWTSALVTFH